MCIQCTAIYILQNKAEFQTLFTKFITCKKEKSGLIWEEVLKSLEIIAKVCESRVKCCGETFKLLNELKYIFKRHEYKKFHE